MNQRLLVLTGIFGAFGVAAGAFGSHGLRARIDAEALAVWDTAVRYHLWHALAIGLAAVLAERVPPRLARAAGLAFAVGIVLFSGSLYGLALGGPRWLGPVTPFGGTALIAGWILVALAGIKSRAGAGAGRPPE